MSIKNSMKSVIAQGATVAKAIEEALKKADEPQEFFVKILEEAQAGFLGFGAKKAKIALFFKKDSRNHKNDRVLSQTNYEELFENPSLYKQIEAQQDDLGLLSASSKNIDIKGQSSQSRNNSNAQQNQHRAPIRPQQRKQQGEQEGDATKVPQSQQARRSLNSNSASRSEKRPASSRPPLAPRRAPFEKTRDVENKRSNSFFEDKSSDGSDARSVDRDQRSESGDRRRSRYFSPRPRLQSREQDGGRRPVEHQDRDERSQRSSNISKNNNDSNNS